MSEVWTVQVSEGVDARLAGTRQTGTLARPAKEAHRMVCPVRLALVQVGTVSVMARLTRRSVQRLRLRPGSPVWVQVKTVALLS